MSVESVRREVIGLATSIGQAALHSQFPNDFEYYALGLDLTDADNRIIDTLIFPVMPENIVENRPSINSVQKTLSGVVSMYNTSFAPFDISISGTFGRKLRIIANNPAYSFNGVSGTVQGEGYEAPVFNTSIKTGYGTLKLLEKIRDKSFSVDEKGRPVRLFYYNLAYNSQYLVEFKNLSVRQDKGTNMLWYYTANFKAIAPAYMVRSNNKTSVLTLLSSDVINKGLDSLVNSYKTSYRERASNRRNG